jgi:O-acetyl-ADP-ribose deacetylase (regulator of RNase III)
MTTISYQTGDATRPHGTGCKIIAHICNDLGRWGKGFVMVISKRWPGPEEAYRKWFAEREQNSFALGDIQTVRIDADLIVCNMIGQHGVQAVDGVAPIRYEAVEKCLEKLSDVARQFCASVHMPRIGCGLAGGTWDRIEPTLQRTLCRDDVHVFVYDLERGGEK